MLVQLRVTGEDVDVIAKDLAFLADELGVTPADVHFERVSDCTIIGTALAER
jgi:hypothetical protein